MENDNGWKTKVMIAGIVAGALVGAGAAYLMIQNAESQDTRPTVTTGEGVRLGVMLLGVLRSIADLGNRR